MANTNCLEGMKCPNCGNEDEFRIETVITMKVTDEGTEEIGGEHYWDKDSWCLCWNCDWDGRVKDFYTPAPANKSENIRDECEFCGGKQPCSKPACIEALQAQADYHEGRITTSKGQN